MSVYEKVFAASDQTDAILVVQGYKMHVNKTLLSYHSDYFNTLFNSDFKEKSMEEIPIDDVIFEDFATVLSLIHTNPIKPTVQNAVRILELADRFLLPAAKRHVELFLITTEIEHRTKIQIAAKYELDDLLDNALHSCTKQHWREFPNLRKEPAFRRLSNAVQAKILLRYFELQGYC